jgi:hypothetical protein
MTVESSPSMSRLSTNFGSLEVPTAYHMIAFNALRLQIRDLALRPLKVAEFFKYL